MQDYGDHLDYGIKSSGPVECKMVLASEVNSAVISYLFQRNNIMLLFSEAIVVNC